MANTVTRTGTAQAAINFEARNWYIGVGGVAMVSGVVALIDLFITTIQARYIVGAVVAAGGTLMLFYAIGIRSRLWTATFFLGAVAYLVVSFGLLHDLLFNKRVLMMWSMGLLLMSGGLRCAFAAYHAMPGRQAMLLSGVISLAAAGCIALTWPSIGFWTLGLILATNLGFEGMGLMLLGFALDARSAR